MTEPQIAFSVFVVILGILAFFLFKLINGDLTIHTNEEISSTTYSVFRGNPFTGKKIPKGFTTRKVYKITYLSGRIKYVTKEYES